MRILYSHRIQSRDGQSVHVEEMVAALRAEGHEVLVVGPRFYEQAAFGGESRLVSFLRSRLPFAATEIAELAYNILAYWRLRKAARRFKPDLIYERYNLFYLAGAMLARRTGTKLLLEVNAPLTAERGRFGGLGMRRIAAALERLTWRAAGKVLPVTGVLARMVEQAGVPAARIEVMQNGINPEAFPIPPAPAAPKNRVVLGFVGFVRDWHGLDAVITAIDAARNTLALELIIVGDGPARPALERQAAALGLTDRVRFTGVQPREAIPALIASFDIALQPRVVEYASPLKVFEYMAAGRAIVAPDQENIREILRDGETALLFPPDNPDAMWQAVLRLAGDAELRIRLGDTARHEIAHRDYTWRGNARRVVQLGRKV